MELSETGPGALGALSPGPWELKKGYLTPCGFGGHLKNVKPERSMIRFGFRRSRSPPREGSPWARKPHGYALSMQARCHVIFPRHCFETRQLPWEGGVIILWTQKPRPWEVAGADLPESFHVPAGQVWAQMLHDGKLSTWLLRAGLLTQVPAGSQGRRRAPSALTH